MKKNPCCKVIQAVLVGLALLTFCSNARALNYIFQNHATESWSDVGNWFFLDADGVTLDPAGSLPGNSDSIELYPDSMIDLTGFGHQSTMLMDSPSTIVAGSCIVDTLSVTDGVIEGGATVTVTYKMNVYEDPFIGAAYGANGLHLEGAGTKLTNNSSSSVLVDSAAISMADGATFVNEGTISLLDASEIMGANNGGGNAPATAGILQNYNTIYSSGMTTIAGIEGSAGIDFDNAGTIEVDSGNLTVTGPVTWSTSSGTSTLLTTSTNAMMTIGLNVNQGETVTVKGPGTVFIQGMTLNGTLNCGIVDPTTGLLDPGTIELDGYATDGAYNFGEVFGEIVGTGTLHVLGQGNIGSVLESITGGTDVYGNSDETAGLTLNLDAGAAWNIEGKAVPNSTNTYTPVDAFDAATVNNSGTITVRNGVLDFEGTSVFNNLAGGLVDLQNNSSIGDSGISNNGSPGTVNNYGLVRKVLGSSTDVTVIGPVFNNSGTLQLTVGSLSATTFTQTSTGTLSLGIASSSSYNQIQLGSYNGGVASSLAGSLVLDLQNGYTPAAGTVFPVISNLVGEYTPNTITGNFSMVTPGFTSQDTGSTLNAIYSGATTDPFGGSPLGGGWNYSSWFGYYNSTYYPWDYRTDLGFIYVDTSDNTNLYLYVVNGNPAPMGWLYTSQSVFPNVYSFTKGSWLYFDVGTTSFYNYTTQAWETY